jgi:hypothetical protein
MRPNEILAGDADRPTKPGGLRDDLIERVDGFRPADPRDRLHFAAALEQLHAERDGPQLQQALQIGGQFPPIMRHASSPGSSVPAPAIPYFRWAVEPC